MELSSERKPRVGDCDARHPVRPAGQVEGIVDEAEADDLPHADGHDAQVVPRRWMMGEVTR